MCSFYTENDDFNVKFIKLKLFFCPNWATTLKKSAFWQLYFEAIENKQIKMNEFLMFAHEVFD